jgi:precorrin-6A/cobalt-precorrin-6A reductase
MHRLRVLILGGTSEAASLAGLVAPDPRFDAVISFAGTTREPTAAPIPMRVGGFGGASGLADYLQTGHFEGIVDATHPFAIRIKQNAAIAAAKAGIARLVVHRAEWTPEDGDRWTVVPDIQQAAAVLGPVPRRVLLTIGRRDLGPFAAHPWHRYVVRSVETSDVSALPAGTVTISARGPFTELAECALLVEHGIEVLVTKNSGGSAAAAKLAAARGLGLAVVIVARPAPPEGTCVGDAAAAFQWLTQLHQAAAPLSSAPIRPLVRGV